MNLFTRINKQLLVECEDGNVTYTQPWWNCKVPQERTRTEEEQECFQFAISIIEDYAKRTNLKVNTGDVSKVACYNWEEDVVTCPCLEQFENDADFFGTLFHEIVHSTAHKTRLNRPKFEHLADKCYCEEELIAELGAMYLMAICCYNEGRCFEQSASYIKHYKAQTGNEDAHLLNVAKDAMRAVFYILGEQE